MSRQSDDRGYPDDMWHLAVKTPRLAASHKLGWRTLSEAALSRIQRLHLPRWRRTWAIDSIKRPLVFIVQAEGEESKVHLESNIP